MASLGVVEKQLYKEDEVIANIVGILRDIPAGINLGRLNECYEQIYSRPIPYKELGYSGLKTFLIASPLLSFTMDRVKLKCLQENKMRAEQLPAVNTQVGQQKIPNREEQVKHNITKILERHPDGILACMLPDLYSSIYGETIPFNELGYSSLKRLLMASPIISLIDSNKGSIIVKLLLQGNEKGLEQLPTTNAPVDQQVLKVDAERHMGQLLHLFENVPHGIELTTLSEKYQSIIGIPLPYTKYGFQSFNEFLLSSPQVTIRNHNNQDYVYFKTRTHVKNDETIPIVEKSAWTADVGLCTPSQSSPGVNSSGLSKEKTVSYLKACIVSSPRGIPATELNREFKALVGQDIPFLNLGFTTLPALIKSLPDFEIVRRLNVSYIQVKVCEESKHIADLVKRQKNAPGAVRIYNPPKQLGSSKPSYPTSYDNSRSSSRNSVDELKNYSLNSMPDKDMYYPSCKQINDSKPLCPTSYDNSRSSSRNSIGKLRKHSFDSETNSDTDHRYMASLSNSSSLLNGYGKTSNMDSTRYPLDPNDIASQWECLIDTLGSAMKQTLMAMDPNQRPFVVNLTMNVLKEGLSGTLSKSSRLSA